MWLIGLVYLVAAESLALESCVKALIGTQCIRRNQNNHWARRVGGHPFLGWWFFRGAFFGEKPADFRLGSDELGARGRAGGQRGLWPAPCRGAGAGGGEAFGGGKGGGEWGGDPLAGLEVIA